MVPELGHFALILALLLAAAQSAFGLAGATRGAAHWMAAARSTALGQLAFVAFAFAALLWSFANNDFSVLNVASNSNSRLPLPYRLAAAWGSHEGSLLLWALMMAGWTAAVALLSRRLPESVCARVLGVMGLVSVGFLLFMLATSNPFQRLLPPAAEGRDLNPLLQDPGMVIHPPMLYMGYVGFSVAFAFAIAALLEGRLDASWARWSRPWTTAAWMFLTLGVMLGSWWAYNELGWGGWWFWDPVENASFMPWLIGTALIHSLAATEKRGAFKSWTALLAIAAFSLSLLGTFLVRSGVLTSVHAFATDPARGVFMLAFLSLVVGASLALYAWRAPQVGRGTGFELLSRESMLLANNVALAAAAGTVLLGTLYPLAIDALGLGKLSVGPPYFNTVFVPLMAPAVFLIGIGPVTRWRQAGFAELARRLRYAFAAGVALALVLPLFAASWKPVVSLGLLLALWIACSVAAALWVRLRDASGGGGLVARIARQPRSYYGMHLAHLGVAVFVAGTTLLVAYEIETDVKLSKGETTTLAGYAFRFDGVREAQGPNYSAVIGQVSVAREGKTAALLHPEKRRYHASGQTMTEAAIDAGWTRDLYVALGDPLGDGAWTLRLYFKPFIRWIWAGWLLMALGGLLAVTDRRYRAEKRHSREAIAAVPAPEAQRS
ncbi:MAG: heme lyase CcmF/NrfE family subunit [Burkholderiales bacterium]